MNKITMGQPARPSVTLVIGMNKEEAMAFLETEPVRAWLAESEAAGERRTYEGPYFWPGQSLEYIPMPADDVPADVWTLPDITQEQWDAARAKVAARRQEMIEEDWRQGNYQTPIDPAS